MNLDSTKNSHCRTQDQIWVAYINEKLLSVQEQDKSKVSTVNNTTPIPTEYPPDPHSGNA